MMKLNVEPTFIISDWCKLNNVPLIFSSSASVEGNEGMPETLYAWSKYIGEKYVLANGGLALRYFNVLIVSLCKTGLNIYSQNYKYTKLKVLARHI